MIAEGLNPDDSGANNSAVDETVGPCQLQNVDLTCACPFSDLLMSMSHSAGQHRSPLTLLIAHGASFTPVVDVNAEARAKNERRRQARNVEHFLQRKYEMEAARKAPPSAPDKRLGIDVKKVRLRRCYQMELPHVKQHQHTCLLIM